VQELAERGWTLLEYTGDLVELATRFGEPVPARAGAPLLSRLRVQAVSDGNPNSLTSRHGAGRFPFHTDGAHFAVVPRYLLLRLEAGSESQRATEVLDLVGRIDQTGLRLLQTEQWKYVAGGVALLSPILSAAGLRYDTDIMRPAVATRARAGEIIRHLIQTSRPTAINWEPAIVAVLDNHRVVHARSEGTGRPEDRVLERVLVNER